METKHYIGIDVSKDTLDYAVCREGEVIFQSCTSNEKKGIRQMLEQLRGLPEFHLPESVFCMEHTGIYNYHLLAVLEEKKTHIWLETPMRLKRSLGMKRGKSDRIDARNIAQYAYTFRENMQCWIPERSIIRKLKHLLRMRERLLHCITQLTVPLQEDELFREKKESRLGKQVFRSSLCALKKDKQRVEKQIAELIESDAYLKNLFDLVKSVEGVGTVTAAHVLAATNEFRKINDPKKFACYAGVAPFEHTSGTSVRGRTRVSHLANKKLKCILHLSAMAVLHTKGELRNYFDRKVAEGKNKMSVINAIRNKIIGRIFAVVQRQTPYQKNYVLHLVES